MKTQIKMFARIFSKKFSALIFNFLHEFLLFFKGVIAYLIIIINWLIIFNLFYVKAKWQLKASELTLTAILFLQKKIKEIKITITCM